MPTKIEISKCLDAYIMFRVGTFQILSWNPRRCVWEKSHTLVVDTYYQTIIGPIMIMWPNGWWVRQLPEGE